MTYDFTAETRATLMLAGPLIAGNGNSARAPRLTVRELTGLEVALAGFGETLGVLASRRGTDIVSQLEDAGQITPDFAERVSLLLRRGFAMAAALESWQRKGIWTVCRYDPDYPKPLIHRLGSNAPPLLHGYGEIAMLNDGWLAIQGSRNAGDESLDLAGEVGASVARHERAVVSGGARGIDLAGMNGALNGGGAAIGVLVEGLARHARTIDSRRFIEENTLTLFTPYDPDARFTVGNAMARNKIIFALAEHSLIADAVVGKGGTWSGATEELARLRRGLSSVPVYVPAHREEAWVTELLKLGAHPWPGVEELIRREDEGLSLPVRSVPSQQLAFGSSSETEIGTTAIA